MTVFAPTNEAFEKIRPVSGSSAMARIVKHYIVSGRLSPSQLPGTHSTLLGEKITVVPTNGVSYVNGKARVVCSNITTRNATVYAIDGLLDAD